MCSGARSVLERFDVISMAGAVLICIILIWFGYIWVCLWVYEKKSLEGVDHKT